MRLKVPTRIVYDGLHRLFQTMHTPVGRQLMYPALSHEVGRDLRLNIPPDVRGQTDVAENEVADFGLKLTRFVELHRRDDESFLHNMGRISTPTSRRRTADIDPVSLVRGKCDKFAIAEDRPRR